MTTNPDIIIATPGRFLHLKVEMGLDLSSVKYIVFDEADRLFEMGFAAQLSEILHALPMSRQTLLFSATLPKSLVEFARAGLQEPRLIRLDDSKVSPDLESAFFTVKSAERDGALLHILDKIIKMSQGDTEAASKAKNPDTKVNGKKRKRGPEASNPVDTPTPNSTIVFAATKHRVEYLASLLKAAGYSVSYGKLLLQTFQFHSTYTTSLRQFRPDCSQDAGSGLPGWTYERPCSHGCRSAWPRFTIPCQCHQLRFPFATQNFCSPGRPNC